MNILNEINNKLEANLFLKNLITIIIIIIATIIIKKIINILFERKLKSKILGNRYEAKTKTIMSIFKNFINVLIYFVSITSILNVFNINTSSILAVAGVGGVAIAFASKSIVEDLITGGFILIENQFNIGDLVTINSITATVIFMGLRITKLQDIDGKEIIMPNSQIKTVINHSVNPMRAAININISSFKNIDFIKSVINEGIKNAQNKFEYFTQAPEILGIDDISDYSYKFLISGQTKNGQQWTAQRILREEILKKLIENKISFSSIKEMQ